jgi:hypothetical protein
LAAFVPPMLSRLVKPKGGEVVVPQLRGVILLDFTRCSSVNPLDFRLAALGRRWCQIKGRRLFVVQLRGVILRSISSDL